MWMVCFGGREGGPRVLGLLFVEMRRWKGLVTWSERETEPRARVMGTAGGFLMPQTWAAQGAPGAAGGRGYEVCRRFGALVGLSASSVGLSWSWAP